MGTLDERIARDAEKLQKLKRQKQAQLQRERQKERAIDTRRKIIAGAILLDVFPRFHQLQPQKNNAENHKEFAPLANFLKCLADNKVWVLRLEIQAKNMPYVPPTEQQNTGQVES